MTVLNEARRLGPFLPSTFSATPMPAQLITTERLPEVERAASIAPCTEASSTTSVFTNMTESPSSPASALPSSLFRSAITTFAPAWLSRRTQAAPSPEAPPVTRTPLFFRSIPFFSFLSPHRLSSSHFMVALPMSDKDHREEYITLQARNS